MECKKCKRTGSVLLRKRDYYCDECFLTNINHKFRASIGKNKILTRNENVLVCLSGGIGSTVLLDLIYSGISMENNKKLRVSPVFLHLIGTESHSLSNAETIIKVCEKYNFDVYLIHISQYMEENLDLPATNCIPPVNSTTTDQYESFINSLPATAGNDLILKIKRDLFIKCAKALHCSLIFTAQTTTTLAIHLLSNIALGRGSEVEHDVGFSDARDENIIIIRPMKDISQEELSNYLKIKNLEHSFSSNIKQNSLQSVIGAFVTDLQGNFPATISTVCKTADKIGVHKLKTGNSCVLCQGGLGINSSMLTALEATRFSGIVSYKKTENNEALKILEDKNINTSLFPYISKKLCYGCSRNYAAMNKCKMPDHVHKLIQNK